MANAPYGFRLLVGAAATVVEETLRLPQTLLMYPMTLASQAAHIVMRFQQNVAELVIKGDETLETLFPPKDEQAEWATFDEDVESADGASPAPPESDGARLTEGRFALYSSNSGASETAATPPNKRAGKPTLAALPDVAVELDYESLTLAQLRARITSLSVQELDDLLAYEGATRARAPFQTLLANRITRAGAK